jgi:intracellular sulfur oxidation DsrE/DsrF family protein
MAQSNTKNDSLVVKISDSLIRVISAKYSGTIRDSIVKKVRDSLHWEKIKSTGFYPLIKNSEWSAAFPVNNVGEKPDPSMKYKLLFNMVIWSRDSLSLKRINEGLAEIGRIINLHIAAGVPKENLELAIVVHGNALNVYLKNDVYQKKFKTDNPNLDILRQFVDLKTKLMACGQAELFTNIPAEDLIPEVKTAFSANVVLSTYQLKGYILYNIEDEK